VRKTVTVLFADIVSSTSRGEQTDPESTRRRLARYFEAMRKVVERHGGTVEKFIGDAVMAVFGIPVLHEDDAVRAVRAARDIGVAVEALNAELVGTGWAPIALRIGVNTGEVVAGDPISGQTLVTGDAVNVAARLEQAANPGEVLLGAATQRLVRGAVDAEPMAPLELKGKATPVVAYRLVGLKESEPGRRHETPLVDRLRELQLLNDSFQRAVDERACYLFTLLGSAGVGKSRLIHEFLNQTRDHARVLRARCLPYGEGITFWPIIELTQAAAGITPGDSPAVARDKLATLVAGSSEPDAIVERVAGAVGLSTEAVRTEEIFWGVRKLLEVVAADRPLVVVIDDLHWAEPTLLDLVDQVADLSRQAPILLLAVARPELIEARPHWGGGKLNATTMLLEPLTAEDSTHLIGNLIHDEVLARTVQERISDTAEGNPLFVEELVAMLIDEGVLQPRNGGWEAAEDLRAVHVPPSISALVAARLDHLEPNERDLIGRASVVGKVFQRSAVAELSPPERRTELGARLIALVRKELVRPDQSAQPGDEAFRFRHILVRDAAYGALPKEQRADLHARFADWLERTAGDRLLEYEEVIGYHFGQAHAFRSELGLTDELTSFLGTRAADHLRSAGIRAWARYDAPAADSLMSRAADLTGDVRERAQIWLRLVDIAWFRGQLPRARQLLADVRDIAEAQGDELVRAHAEMNAATMALWTDPTAGEDAVLSLSERTEALAIARSDLRARVEALQSRSTVWLGRCRWADMLEALEEALLLLRGDDPESQLLRRDVEEGISTALRWGPTSASEAAARIDEMASVRVSWSYPLYVLSPQLLAMQGQNDAARELIDTGIAYVEERGLGRFRAALSWTRAQVETIAGDLEAAELSLAEAIAVIQPKGETAVVSTQAAQRAIVLYRLGRVEEMEEAIRLAQETASATDIATQGYWRVAAGQRAADQGHHDEAQRLVGEALALVEPTDFPELRGQVFEAQAHVQARAGHAKQWRAALERALGEHERKGNLIDASRIRDLMAGPPPQVPT
jgi:class 3 adenylate cyclase/tetratricopeptide (TPR) repeat protein